MPRAAALDESKRFPLFQPSALASLFRTAGLANVETDELEIPTDSIGFDFERARGLCEGFRLDRISLAAGSPSVSGGGRLVGQRRRLVAGVDNSTAMDDHAGIAAPSNDGSDPAGGRPCRR